MTTLPTLDPLPVLLATGAVAILLLHAAWAKLADRGLFEQHLAAYGVPDAALAPLAWALPAAELAAALGLMTPWRGTAALVAALLLALYGGAMAWQLAHGRRPDCGCGGAPLPLSRALVARNAGLVALALAAALPVGHRALGLADVATAAAGWLLLTLVYAAFNQVLRQAAHLKTLSPSSSLTSRSPS